KSDNAEMPERLVMVINQLFESFEYMKGLQYKFPISDSRRGGQFRDEFTFAVMLLLGNNRKRFQIAFREWLRDDRQSRRIQAAAEQQPCLYVAAQTDSDTIGEQFSEILRRFGRSAIGCVCIVPI